MTIEAQRRAYYELQLRIWLGCGISFLVARDMALWHVKAAFGELPSDQDEFEKDHEYLRNEDWAR